MALHCPDSMVGIARFLDGLSPEKLETLGDIYSPAVEFRNPIHQTRGLTDLRKVYESLLQRLVGIAIKVIDAHGDERTGFLLWEMRFPSGGTEQVIAGTSHFRFAPDGRIVGQLDHWDASALGHGELPVIGWALRGLRRLVTRH